MKKLKKLNLKKPQQTDYFCFYIYHYPFDDILKFVIEPFLTEKNITNFFFIKYFDKGPHIRLRVKSNDETEGNLYERLNSIFKEYLKTYSTDKELFKKDSREDFNPEWKSDHIEIVKYDPTNEWYSGSAQKLIEDQFQLSSKKVLEFISNNDEISYNSKLGFALQLNIELIKSLNLPTSQVISYYNLLSKGMLSQDVIIDNSIIWLDEKTYKNRLKRVEVQYQNSKDTIVKILSNSWNDNDISEWISFNSSFLNLFKNSLASTNQISSAEYNKDYLNDIDNTTLYHIYSNILHLTNNRLGLYTFDEAYIAFVVYKYLSEEL